MTVTNEPKAELMRLDAINHPLDYIHARDDFITMPVDDTTGDPLDWEIVQDAGATAQIGPADGKGGWFQVACDGDDNDEAYAANRSEAFIFNTTDMVFFEARVKHTAGSTDGKGSFILGLSDTVAADSITDAGSLMSSFDGAVFIKGEDDNIDFATSNAAAQVRNEVATWVDGSTHRLGFLYLPEDGVTAVVIPIVDGVPQTAHELTISGLEEMHLFFGVKTHEAAEQTLLVDWYEVVQDR